ncbi:hypothetical protein QE177_04410 [Arsenophonus sp. aPb]|uniref:hypothetical protein n=1 Tax=Arsenophonus sp. aPb TaxID=3041619 RepID=UPI002468C6AD|nr:hypothetical protein [Arsenophonus sp. aPb]WGL99130.1 hypothetical protein QE177_04410 [Arsenophonus sp. aPb]
MATIIYLPRTGRTNSKMRRYEKRGRLMMIRRLEENIRRSKRKFLESIIDKAFGIKNSVQKELTTKRKKINTWVNVIVDLIVQFKGNVEKKVKDTFDNCCMPTTAMYSTKRFNSKPKTQFGISANA